MKQDLHKSDQPINDYQLNPLPYGYIYLDNEPTPNGFDDAYIIESSDKIDLYHYRIKELIYKFKSPFQKIIIADTYNYGRCLFLDGSIQSSNFDESLYHELLVQPAMIMHNEPREILIIGGGEGACLREVLLHRSVIHATMVDIDSYVVNASKEYLKSWHKGAFNSTRADLKYGDGREFLNETNNLYDVIIIDIVDMLDNSPAQLLYTYEFYKIVKSKLRNYGIVVVQGLEFSFLDYKQHAAIARTLRSCFHYVSSYAANIPSFLGSWGFLIASDTINPENISSTNINQIIANKIDYKNLEHLDGNFIKSTFELCKQTKFNLELNGPILKDNVPYIDPPDVLHIEPEEYNFESIK